MFNENSDKTLIHSLSWVSVLQNPVKNYIPDSMQPLSELKKVTDKISRKYLVCLLCLTKYQESI